MFSQFTEKVGTGFTDFWFCYNQGYCLPGEEPMFELSRAVSFSRGVMWPTGLNNIKG